jgi:hypothetical protein
MVEEEEGEENKDGDYGNEEDRKMINHVICI